MGTDHSKPPKYTKHSDVQTSKVFAEQIDPCDDIKEIKQIQPTKLSSPNFLNMLYISHGNELFNILQQKNIVVELEDIKNGILDIIIKNDDIDLFKKVLNLTNNPTIFLNDTYKGEKIFEYIYKSTLSWKIIEEILQYVDLTYRSGDAISTWLEGNTILHTVCWHNKYDLIKKIINMNKDLLFMVDTIGFTPLYYLLIGSYIHGNDYSKYVDLFTFICATYNSSQLLKLFEYTTTKEYKREATNYKNKIIIPAGSSFANVMEIIKSVETINHKKIITENNKIITEHILKQISSANDAEFSVKITYS